MKGLDYTVLILVVIGAVNWGLVGFFGLDLRSEERRVGKECL